MISFAIFAARPNQQIYLNLLGLTPVSACQYFGQARAYMTGSLMISQLSVVFVLAAYSSLYDLVCHPALKYCIKPAALKLNPTHAPSAKKTNSLSLEMYNREWTSCSKCCLCFHWWPSDRQVIPFCWLKLIFVSMVATAPNMWACSSLSTMVIWLHT